MRNKLTSPTIASARDHSGRGSGASSSTGREEAVVHEGGEKEGIAKSVTDADADSGTDTEVEDPTASLEGLRLGVVEVAAVASFVNPDPEAAGSLARMMNVSSMKTFPFPEISSMGFRVWSQGMRLTKTGERRSGAWKKTVAVARKRMCLPKRGQFK